MPSPHVGQYASFQLQSSNRKLARQRVVRIDKYRKRNEPIGPRCSSTYTSIHATCPSGCPWKGNGCYAQEGAANWFMQRMDTRAREDEVDGLAVTQEEADLIRNAWATTVAQDGARGGRDLRLHVGGDVSCADGATLLAAAVDSWYSKGGGAAWTFTKRWEEIPYYHWGEIQTLASVVSHEEIEHAIERGYTPAMVVPRHEHRRAYRSGALRVIPCVAQTHDRTCIECRLCLDATLPRGTVIAFEAHGPGEHHVRKALTQLRLPQVVTGSDGILW